MGTAWLILLFPLLGCVVISLGYKLWRGKLAGVIGTVAILASFICSINVLLHLQDRDEDDRQVVKVAWNLAKEAGVDAQLSTVTDPPSVFMAPVGSGVSMLIHLRALSYMGSDRGYTRFFSYLNFF